MSVISAILSLLASACGGGQNHFADAVNDTDTLPTMTAKGICNFISDSGIVKYKMIAEEWLIFEAEENRQGRWDFKKGFFMQKYAPDRSIDWYIQSDTAYCYHDDLWELRSNVVMRNAKGAVFRTEQIFWDMSAHEIYSSKYMSIKEPDRELDGYNFRSNEQMTKYTIYNSTGMLPVEDIDKEPETEDKD